MDSIKTVHPVLFMLNKMKLDKSIFGKFVLNPKTVMLCCNEDDTIIVCAYFQLAGRLQSLDIGHRVCGSNSTNFRFSGCSATTSGLSLLNYQFIGFHFISSKFKFI